jgi:hypothetical protein
MSSSIISTSTEKMTDSRSSAVRLLLAMVGTMVLGAMMLGAMMLGAFMLSLVFGFVLSSLNVLDNGLNNLTGGGVMMSLLLLSGSGAGAGSLLSGSLGAGGALLLSSSRGRSLSRCLGGRGSLSGRGVLKVDADGVGAEKKKE